MKKVINYLLTAIVLTGSFSAGAQFLYNQPITVTNNENKLVTRWQIPIYVNTATEVAANRMNANGSDIRFSKDCVGNQPLDFFIDSGMNSSKTKIWVKLDTLYPSATLVIYMRYGNTTATPASTYETFNGPYSSCRSILPLPRWM